jgi:DNA repair photolyase
MTNSLKYVPSKTIITKSKLPDTDYVVNPYIGCSFGCSYCYASFMGRRVDQSIKNWGNYVYVKENCVDLFTKELSRFIKNNNTGSILFSSVTDPYLPLEAKLLLTREMLTICASKAYKGKISILTKSPLVTRDSKIIKALQSKEVGLTISHVLKDELVQKMEKNAPSFSVRLRTLEKLNAQGINTYAFIGPLMPHFFDDTDQIEEIFRQISQIGTKEVFVEYLNITPYIKERIMYDVNVNSKFYKFYNQLNKKELSKEYLDAKIYSFIEKYSLKLRLNQTITHSK